MKRVLRQRVYGFAAIAGVWANTRLTIAEAEARLGMEKNTLEKLAMEMGLPRQRGLQALMKTGILSNTKVIASQ